MTNPWENIFIHIFKFKKEESTFYFFLQLEKQEDGTEQ